MLYWIYCHFKYKEIKAVPVLARLLIKQIGAGRTFPIRGVVTRTLDYLSFSPPGNKLSEPGTTTLLLSVSWEADAVNSTSVTFSVFCVLTECPF